MSKIFLIILSILVLNCSGPVNDDATAVCNCYKELLKVSSEDEIKLEVVSDSCQKLHSSVLKKFENDSVAFQNFIEAYTYCQNQ